VIKAPGLPEKYHWLIDLDTTLPRMIQEALRLYGTHELAGDLNSPTILAWAKEAGLQATYTADAIPWCGLFAAVVAKRAGKLIPDGPLWALNWAKFGEPAGQPQLGDVLVFTRIGGGHVGFYVGEDQTAYHVLGGNTSDAVSIARIEKRRLYAARRPHYHLQPSSARPYMMADTGLISTNEA